MTGEPVYVRFPFGERDRTPATDGRLWKRRIKSFTFLFSFRPSSDGNLRLLFCSSGRLCMLGFGFGWWWWIPAAPLQQLADARPGTLIFFYLVDISISCPIVTEMILTVPLPFLLSVACCHFRSVSRVVRPRRRATDVAFFTVTDSGRGLVSHGSEYLPLSSLVMTLGLATCVRVEIGGAAFWTPPGSAVRTNESENSAVVLGFVA